MFKQWERGSCDWRHRSLQVRVDYCPSIRNMSFINYRHLLCFNVQILRFQMCKNAWGCSVLAKTSIDCLRYVYSATWDGSHSLQMQIFLLWEALLSIILLVQTFMMCIYVFYAHSWCVNHLYCAVNVKVAETKKSVSTLNLQKLIRIFFTPKTGGTKAL